MQNTASFSAKSQNLGSIAADKPSSFLRKQESRCWFDLDSCFRRNDEVFCDTLLRRNDEGLLGMTIRFAFRGTKKSWQKPAFFVY